MLPNKHAVRVYYTRFGEKLSDEKWDFYLSKVPSELQSKIIRYHRWQDRQAHLFGKLLLMKGLEYTGYSNSLMKNIKYNKFHRPYISQDGLDFNISHSGEFVVCAIGKEIRVGIDIEEIKPVNLKDFGMAMNVGEWDEILNAPAPFDQFYKYWTIKESVVKADGRGLYIAPKNVSITRPVLNYNFQNWYIHDLDINADYPSTLATSRPNINVELQQLEF